MKQKFKELYGTVIKTRNKTVFRQIINYGGEKDFQIAKIETHIYT